MIADGGYLRSAIALEAKLFAFFADNVGRSDRSSSGIRLEGGKKLPETKIILPKIPRLCELANSLATPLIIKIFVGVQGR